MHPLVQQTEGLCHVVCRSHRCACVATRLLHETKSIVRPHHLLADSPETPGGEKVIQLNNEVQIVVFSGGSVTFLTITELQRSYLNGLHAKKVDFQGTFKMN